MPIKEESFRIGCGRYLQGRNYIEKIADEVLSLGTCPLVVGDSTAFDLTKSKLESSLSAIKHKMVTHNGTCNKQDAEKLSKYMAENGLNVVVGVGGGVIMDFAKLIALYGNVPIINIPTSSATCAAYTPLSVCYTPEGRTVGSVHHKKEVNCVIVDTDIIIKQPVRLLLSGVFDSLAKFVEIKHRFNETVVDYPLGLNWAYCLSKEMFSDLCNLTEPAIEEMKNGIPGDAFERIVFSAICTTGVISGIARGSNQCALGHKFYEISRKMFFQEVSPYLHGEIVGVGLLLQNIYNGEAERNEFLLSLMKKHNMPHSVKTVGLNNNEKTKNVFFEHLSNSSSIDLNNSSEVVRLSESLDAFFEIV